MPAPQASQMQQFARLKFTSFNLKVPTNWRDPQGEDGDHYRRAFKADEKVSSPGMPPLFQPASLNKYHTDTQKMHIAKVGKFIDDTCSAICSAWGQWQTAATMAGFVVTGPVASGGKVVGPPLQPLILVTAPKASPQEMKYTNAIATVISNTWMQYTMSITSTGLPLWPQFGAFPGPLVPPPGIPSAPTPLSGFVQVPPLPAAMKQQMVGMLADAQAPFHAELFEAIIDGFDKCFQIWSKSTMVTNVLGMGSVPTFAPPVVPAGPVVGSGMMPPGGFK